MIKLRVHDLAGEFGISSADVMSMLRAMDVPVRSHLSPLTDEQVARLRARWEREKRARQEKPAPTSSRRRRGAAAPEPAPPPVVEETSDSAPIRRRRRADVEAATEAAEAVAAAAAADAEAEAAAREPAPVEPEPFDEPEVREVERAPAPMSARPTPVGGARVSAPPAADETLEPPQRAPAPVSEPSDDAREQRRVAASAAPSPAQPTRPAPGRMPPRTGDGGGDRPRPAAPLPPRPRPASAGAYLPPRPVASAAPGAGTSMPTRRDDRSSQQSSQSQQQQQQQRGGKRKKGKRGNVDQEAVTANISRTMAAMHGGPARRAGRRPDDAMGREELEAQRAAAVERERKTVRVNEFITVSELAAILKVPATQIVGFAFKTLGLMVTINQRLDFDQIELIAGEFGFQAVREEEYSAAEAVETVVDRVEDLQSRPPVVTIMGHVDHGKTSLLDYIRSATVVAGEAGGITQHIGAYHVQLPGPRLITFLDTPGHEAFTAMRARGAQVTDIVVLVVAADDAVMPQTIEAISHARNAGVPLVVAINKIDLPQANVGRVKQDLLQHGVVLEEFGGDTLSTEISAKQGTNVATLLEQILLQAEILDLKANPDRAATGTVVEAQLDPGKGPVATVLVQNGTLKVGDDFIVGMYAGRVRALLDERGRPVKTVGPAIPVQVLGIEGVPMAGDQFLVADDASGAREIAQRRQRLDREAKSRRGSRGGGVSLEDFMAHAAAGEMQQLRIVIKADQGGPAEALADALQQLSTSEVQVQVIHRGVGAISESDILLAKASGAIILGFHVRPDNNARAAADREGVDIKLYRVIYEAVADVRAALEGLLRPEEREVVLGEAEVRELFRVPRIGVIAGCGVRSGVIQRTARVRVVRDGVEIYDGTIASLRRFKEDVREVREGFECGIGIENFNDLKVSDVIECYKTEEVARTLS